MKAVKSEPTKTETTNEPKPIQQLRRRTNH